ncbi:PIN domain nuclease, a component of toxin-antitoxin system (PIN domain) [Fulvimarina manganoxydans]|uniref:PIN domain nuclease, a component of toxin-antitoxin system (PIN domain) n=1 Tax=Fulvimarina manganoxydans TaxID=937218 RepID=A0A1W2ENF2_9HYPH|nr:type II toxin-antitoxin system VapC family toxin [Fulvimarina manganoxydans]SMD11243.1 PIN domain nuclease, a component of toxin-antitoxin system (PIN domain) [Fulvimarina manganoxydans]
MGCVLDASAILCLLFSETGAKTVEARLGEAMVSAVNYTEVLSKLIDRGLDPDEAIRDFAELDMTIVPVSQDDAEEAARLRMMTQHMGLSLGDRYCLALAKLRGVPAMTTDQAWKRIDTSAGIEIEFAR